MKKEEQDLLRLKDILDKSGIPFFLIEGTLLGALRDGTLIEYDKDFDIGTSIDVDNLGVRERVMEGFRNEKLKITLRGPDLSILRPSYWFLIEGLKWPVALLPYITVDEHAIFATIPIKFPAHLFRKLRTFEFLDTKFCIPDPPEEYLEVNYGPTWRIRARRRAIIRGSNPIELYKHPDIEKVYLRCEKDGTLVEPLESIGPQLD